MTRSASCGSSLLQHEKEGGKVSDKKDRGGPHAAFRFRHLVPHNQEKKEREEKKTGRDKNKRGGESRE